jgi:hypothetical protein
MSLHAASWCSIGLALSCEEVVQRAEERWCRGEEVSIGVKRLVGEREEGHTDDEPLKEWSSIVGAMSGREHWRFVWQQLGATWWGHVTTTGLTPGTVWCGCCSPTAWRVVVRSVQLVASMAGRASMRCWAVGRGGPFPCDALRLTRPLFLHSWRRCVARARCSSRTTSSSSTRQRRQRWRGGGGGLRGTPSSTVSAAETEHLCCCPSTLCTIKDVRPCLLCCHTVG